MQKVATVSVLVGKDVAIRCGSHLYGIVEYPLDRVLPRLTDEQRELWACFVRLCELDPTSVPPLCAGVSGVERLFARIPEELRAPLAAEKVMPHAGPEARLEDTIDPMHVEALLVARLSLWQSRRRELFRGDRANTLLLQVSLEPRAVLNGEALVPAKELVAMYGLDPMAVMEAGAAEQWERALDDLVDRCIRTHANTEEDYERWARLCWQPRKYHIAMPDSLPGPHDTMVFPPWFAKRMPKEFEQRVIAAWSAMRACYDENEARVQREHAERAERIERERAQAQRERAEREAQREAERAAYEKSLRAYASSYDDLRYLVEENYDCEGAVLQHIAKAVSEKIAQVEGASSIKSVVWSVFGTKIWEKWGNTKRKSPTKEHVELRGRIARSVKELCGDGPLRALLAGRVVEVSTSAVQSITYSYEDLDECKTTTGVIVMVRVSEGDRIAVIATLG